MAVRIDPRHSDRTREKIRTGMIVNRLQRYFKGEIELSAGQLKAADILLKKRLPDLAPIAHDGAPVGNTVVQVIFGAGDGEPPTE